MSVTTKHRIVVALTVGFSIELVMLILGGFKIQVGGHGSEGVLLFLIHMPAMLICTVFPDSWQTVFAAVLVNTLLISCFVFGLSMFVGLVKTQLADGRTSVQTPDPSVEG